MENTTRNVFGLHGVTAAASDPGDAHVLRDKAPARSRTKAIHAKRLRAKDEKRG